MLPLLACLSVAINCYKRGSITNDGCNGLPQDACLKTSATFPSFLQGCRWESGQCKSVCGRSYRKADAQDENGVLQKVHLKKDHCYERAGAASVGVCVASSAMQGGSTEENEALLKIAAVQGYVDDINPLYKTLVEDDIYTFRKNEEVTIAWVDFEFKGGQDPGNVVFTIAKAGGEAHAGDTLDVSVVKNGASLKVSPQSAHQVTVTVTKKMSLDNSFKIVFKAGGDYHEARVIHARFGDSMKTVIIEAWEDLHFRKMVETEDPDRIMTPLFEDVTPQNIYFKTTKHFISLQALAALAEKRIAGEAFALAPLHGMRPTMYWHPDGLFDIPYIGSLPYIENRKTKMLQLKVPNDEYNDILDKFPQEVISDASGGSYNPFGRFASDVAIDVYLKVGEEEKEKFKEAMKDSIEKSVGDQTHLIQYLDERPMEETGMVLVFTCPSFDIYQTNTIADKYKTPPFSDKKDPDVMNFANCQPTVQDINNKVESVAKREEHIKDLKLGGKKGAKRIDTHITMGKSAKIVAEACSEGGKALNQKYEWLHRVGHSLAGRRTDFPQNLMLGTKHTNSHMITFETLLSKGFKWAVQGIRPSLKTELKEGSQLFAPEALEYTISSLGLGEILAYQKFTLLGTLRPAVMLNVYVYNFFRHVYGKGRSVKRPHEDDEGSKNPKTDEDAMMTHREATVLSTDATSLQTALGLKALTGLTAADRDTFASEYTAMLQLFPEMDTTFAVAEAKTGAAVATLASGNDVALTLHALVVGEHYFAAFRAQGTESLLPVLPGLTFGDQRLLVMRDAEGTTEVYVSCTVGLEDAFTFVPGLVSHVGGFATPFAVTAAVPTWYSLDSLNFDAYLRFRAPLPLPSAVQLSSAGGVTLMLDTVTLRLGVFTAGTTKDVSPSFEADGRLRWGTSAADEVALSVYGGAHAGGGGYFGAVVENWVHPFGIDVTVTRAALQFDLPLTEAEMQVSLDLCNIELSGAYSTTDGVALRGEATCDLQLADVAAWFEAQTGTTGLSIPAEMPDMTITSFGMSVCPPNGHIFASGQSCSSGVQLWGTAATPGGATVAVHVQMDKSRLSVSTTVADFAVTDTIVLRKAHLAFSLGGGVPAVVQLSASLDLSSVSVWVEGEYEAGSVFLKAGLSGVTLEDVVALGAELTGGSAFTVPSNMDVMLTTLELSVCTFENDARCTKGVTVHGAAMMEGVAVDLVITITPEELSFVGTATDVPVGYLTVDTLTLSMVLPRGGGGGGVSLTAEGTLQVTDTLTLTLSGTYSRTDGYSLTGGVDGAVKVRTLVSALYSSSGGGADTPVVSNLQATVAKTTTPPTFFVSVSGHVTRMTLAGVYAAITGDTFPDVFPGLGDIGLSAAVVSVRVEDGGVTVAVATTSTISVPLFGGDAMLSLEGSYNNRKEVSVLGVLRWEADSEDSNFAMRSKEGTGLEISAGWRDDAVGVMARLPLMICIHDCSAPQAQKQIVYIIGELGIEKSGSDVLLAGSLEMQGKLTKLFGVPILHVSDVLVGIKVEMQTRRVDEVKLAGKLELGRERECAVATSTRCLRFEGRLEIYTSSPQDNLVEVRITSLKLGEMWDVAGDWVTALQSFPMPSVLRDLGIQYFEKPGLVCPDANNDDCYALVRYRASEGFRLRGQINFFFGLKLGLDIEVGPSRFYLKTVLQDVTLFGIFKIENAFFEVTEAPSFKLTGKLSVPVLSLSMTVDGTISAHGIDVAAEMNFFGFVRPRVEVLFPFAGGGAKVGIGGFRIGVVHVSDMTVTTQEAAAVRLRAEVSFMYFARATVDVAMSEDEVSFTATVRTPVMDVSCTATSYKGSGRFGLSFSFDFVAFKNLAKAAKAVGQAAVAVGKGIVKGVTKVFSAIGGLFGKKYVYNTPAQKENCRQVRIDEGTTHSIIYAFTEEILGDGNIEPFAYLNKFESHPLHARYLQLAREMHTAEYTLRLLFGPVKKVNEYYTGIHDLGLKEREPADAPPLFPASFCHWVTTDIVYGCDLVQHDGTDANDWFELTATTASNEDNKVLNNGRSWIKCMEDDATQYKAMYDAAVLMADQKRKMQQATDTAKHKTGGLMDLANSSAPDTAQFVVQGVPTAFQTAGQHYTGSTVAAAVVNEFGPSENLGIQAVVRILTDEGQFADELVDFGGVLDLHNWDDLERTVSEAETLISNKMWEVVHKGKAVLQDLRNSIPPEYPEYPTLVAEIDTILEETIAEVEQIVVDEAPLPLTVSVDGSAVTVTTAGAPDELSGSASVDALVAATEAKLVVSHDAGRCGSVTTKTHTVDEVAAFAVAGLPTCGSVYLRVEWTVSDTCGQSASVEQFVVVSPAYTDATGWATTPAQRVDFTMATFVDVAAGAPATHTYLAVGAYRSTLVHSLTMEESGAVLVPGTCEWRYTRTWSAELTPSAAESGFCRAPGALRFTQEVVVANDVAWFSPAVVVPSVALLHDHRVLPTVQFAAPDMLAAVQPVYTAAQAAKGMRYTYDLSHTDVLDDPVVGPLTRTWTVAAPQCTPSLPAVVLTQRVTIVFPEPELGPAVPQTFGCGETQVHTKPHVTSKVDVCGPVTVRIVSTVATPNPFPTSVCGSRYETVTWQAFHRAACGGVGSSPVAQLVSIVPRFSHAPADVSAVPTTSPLAPASTGGAAVADACVAPLAVSYADVAGADGTCGHWTVQRVWTLAPPAGAVPTPSGCVPLTHLQHIHVEDLETPVWTHIPDAAVVVPFFENWRAAHPVPRAAETPHADMVALGIGVSHPTYLTSEDTVVRPWMDAVVEGTCRERGLATLHRTWTAGDRCGNEATFTQEVMLQHPPAALTSTQVWDAGAGLLAYAAGVDQLPSVCDAGKLVSTAGEYDALDGLQQAEEPECDAWDAHGCRRLSAIGVVDVAVHQVRPEFATFPPDATTYTNSTLDAYDVAGGLGYPTGEAYCATPFHIWHRDEAPVLVACGVWTINRVWKVQPHYQDCGTGDDYPASLTRERVQVITVHDLEAPVWTHTPDAAVVVPFFENWRAAHPVPRAAETPHADMVALGIGVSHPTYLTSEDTVVRPWMDAAVEGTCRERGLATLHRTWTAGDRCGNEATFTQEVMLQHPPAALTSTQVWDAGAGLLAYAAGVDQLPSVCDAGKLVSTAGEYDALDGLQQAEEPECDAWDAHGCRRLSAIGVVDVAVHQVRPEFATFPPDATTYTNSTLDAYDVAGGLGYPTGEAYCATPFHIWHRDEAPVLVACGVWTINRVWKVQPHYQDCGTGDDYPASLTRERVQVITVRDVFAPQFASTPAAEVVVAFLNDYGPSVAGVPTVVDVATHADMAALNLTSYRINLTFADTVAFSAAGAAGCTDGLAVVERTWTTEDRCGSADSWRQTIRIEHPRRGGEGTGVMGHVSGFKAFSVGDVSAVDVAAASGAVGTQGDVVLRRSVFGPASAARPEHAATLADNATEQCGAAVANLTDVVDELAEFSDSLLMLPENLCTGPKLVECVRPGLTSSCSVVANTTAPLAEAVVDYADNLTLVGEGQVYNFFTIDLDTWLVKQEVMVEVERRSWKDMKNWWRRGVRTETPVQKPFMRVRAGGFVFVNVVYESVHGHEDTLRDTLFEGASLGPDFVLFNMKQLCSSKGKSRSSRHTDCRHHRWHAYPWHHLAWAHLHHTFASLQYGHHSNHLNLVNVSLPGTLLTQDSYVSVSVVDSEVFGQVLSAGTKLQLATTRFHCNLFVANAVCDISGCPSVP